MDPTASKETTLVDAMSHRTGMPRHDWMYKRNGTFESVVCSSLVLLIIPSVMSCSAVQPIRARETLRTLPRRRPVQQFTLRLSCLPPSIYPRWRNVLILRTKNDLRPLGYGWSYHLAGEG
jgi:hypothetical protein